MSIAGISSNILSQLSLSTSSRTNPMQQAWAELESAINAEDLKSAKTAFQTIQKLHAQQVSNDSASGKTMDTSDMDQAMEELGVALESGDLSAVQDAFATVKSGMKQGPPSPPTGSASLSQDSILELLESIDADSGTNSQTDLTSQLLIGLAKLDVKA
jgi:hypothetical protein